MEFLFITGNQRKADSLSTWLGAGLRHRHLDLDELQSLDLRTVVAHKARQAYDMVGAPVMVEDTALTFTAMGRLPGTFVKWFLAELGTAGLCRLADGLAHREAVASLSFALYDGQRMRYVDSSVSGRVAPVPVGERGFGWDAVFIPAGSERTYAEMTDAEVRPFSMRARAADGIRSLLGTAG